MYAHTRYTAGVRDGRAPYGEPAFPAEVFPGEEVLLDLPGAPRSELPLILARFAALRAWTLTATDAAPALVEHAATATREHLRALDPAWREGILLRALERGGSAAALLEEAAGEAAAAGHRHGARALREAAHRARWLAARYPPPSPS